jgi:hypothetical protein
MDYSLTGIVTESDRMPLWLTSSVCAQLIAMAPALETMQQYQVYHDCGKPFCLQIDPETHKRRYPNHALVSYDTWLACGGDTTVADLIKRDMELHLCKASDIPEFCLDKSQAAALLLTAFCEIFANASMFGGLESDSFKIKFKQLDRRGAQIIKQLGIVISS